MKHLLLLITLTFLIAGCSDNVNPVSSQFVDEPVMAPGFLAKTVNTKIGFDDLLENKYIQKALLAGKQIHLEEYNHKYKLFPGITFSKNIMLGYDKTANPGLGGQVYLYVDGREKSSISFTYDGKKAMPVYMKSFYARILDPKKKKMLPLEKPVIDDPKPEDEIILVVTGYVNNKPVIIKEKLIKTKYERYTEVVDEDLEKQLLKFENEIYRIDFSIKGKVHYYILDEFKYRHTTK